MAAGDASRVLGPGKGSKGTRFQFQTITSGFLSGTEENLRASAGENYKTAYG